MARWPIARRTPAQPSLVVVLGSATRPGRLHRAVSEAARRAVERRGVRARLIDLAEVPFVPADGSPPEAHGEGLASAVRDIASADAAVLATPIYRGSMTGVLKNLLDHLPVEALRGTPVAIVAMGASDHHYLGAERHLRDVLAFFGALVAPTAVYLTSADFADGAPSARAEAELDEAIDAALELASRLEGARPLGPAPLSARPRERLP